MARKRRYTAEQVLEALNATNGLLYLAAQKLGCSSRTVQEYLKRYPEVAEAVAEKRGKRLDVAEAALDKAVLAGNLKAITFLLRTLGKDRGYVEKAELDVTERVRQRVEEEVVGEGEADRPQEGAAP